MTKLQLLHRAVNERLMAAVEQIMEMVGGTVLEYEEETIRVRKENEVLRRRLRWMEGANSADWPGPSEPVTLSNPDGSNPPQQEESAVNIGFGKESEAIVIKTESTDHPLHARPESSVGTLAQSADQGSENAGTSAGVAYSLADGMSWDSSQSYMAPLDFDPTSGSSRFRRWRDGNRRQRMTFACLDCGKVFGREQGLIFHMRIHSKEKNVPYMYRQRKACFYGDKKKKRKLHELSQLSREADDDLSDGFDQLAPDQEEEYGLSTDSDHSSSDKEPDTLPLHPQRRKKKRTQPYIPCYCPHCPERIFSGPGQLGMHMKSHRSPTNLGNQTQSSIDKTVDEARTTLPKKQSKTDGVKRGRPAGKKKFPCPECHRVFLKLSALRCHIKGHELERASSQENLKTAILKTEQRKPGAVKKAKPAGKKKFPCPECHRVFHKLSTLRCHIKDHQCQRASSQENLEMAIQTEPPREEPMEAEAKATDTQNLTDPHKRFACPICHKLFGREGWVEPHIRSQHVGVKIKSNHYNRMCARGNERRSTRIFKQLRMVAIEESIKVTSETQGVTEESKWGTEESHKVTTKAQRVTKESKQETEESLKVTTETQGVTEESKRETEQSKTFNAKPCQFTADLTKSGTDESKRAPEQAYKDTVVSDGGTLNTPIKNRFSCTECDKSFYLIKKLRQHKRKHVGMKLQAILKRKREQQRMEREQEEKRRKEEETERLNTMSTSNHASDTTTPQGFPNKELLPKRKTKQLPCPFCGKIFAWEIRLIMHMQIHYGDKPYLYRQRQKQFYGQNRGKLPKGFKKEPLGKDNSEQSPREEVAKMDSSAHVSSRATHSVPEATAPEESPETATEPPAICDNNNQMTQSEPDDDLGSHPRIVLPPITMGFECWSSMPGDLKSGHSEKSGFDHEQASCSGLVDDHIDEGSDINEMEDTPVDFNLCTVPMESASHGILNEPEICCSVITEKDELGWRDSQSNVELDNSGVSEPNNTEEEWDYDFPGVSRIDDEKADCERTSCDWKCDCNNISSMKLTVMPQDSALDSLFKETSSSGVQNNTDCCVVISDVEDNDEVPSFRSEQLDVGRNLSSSSAESIDFTCAHTNSIDGPLKRADVDLVASEMEDQILSNDLLTRNQMRQIEDDPMSLEEILCQTSDIVFAGQASVSDDNTAVNANEGKDKLGANNLVYSSL